MISIGNYLYNLFWEENQKKGTEVPSWNKLDKASQSFWEDFAERLQEDFS